MIINMEDTEQPDASDTRDYLDMSWAHEELIPFLEEVFTGSEGMSTANWERMVLFARFNRDKIPFYEDFPSTIERLRLCLINASLLTAHELNKFMRVASMGPQMCVRIFVRHAIRHGPYRLHSLGEGPNPCYPRPQEDDKVQPVVVIPKPPKPDVVRKLEAEVKALKLKLEEYENEKKQSQRVQNQKHQNQTHHNQFRQNQHRRNENAGVHNNHPNNHGRSTKGQRTLPGSQDRTSSYHPGIYHQPFVQSHHQTSDTYHPAGAQMGAQSYNPAFFQSYSESPSMYDINPQLYMTMPDYQQQTLLDRQGPVFSGHAPPDPIPTEAPQEWSHNQCPYNLPHQTFPSELATRLQRVQLQQTQSAHREFKSASTSVEDQARLPTVEP